MKKVYNWGIVGLGGIADKFTEDLIRCPSANLLGVGSRSLHKAKAFAKKWSVAHSYGNYEELLNNSDIDIIYIATPHSVHMENTLSALKHGKAVLCEKPFAINTAQSLKMIEAARIQNRFLMDGIWTQFFPFMQSIKSKIDGAEIGRIVAIEADFGFKATIDKSSRLYDPKLGGGALLDIGIYPVFLALTLLGQPEMIHAVSHIQHQIDLSTSIQLKFDNGAVANLFSTIQADTHCEARIYGTDGSIIIPSRWHESDRYVLTKKGKSEEYVFSRDHRGYIYEIEAIHEILNSGEIEHPLLRHDFTLNIMRTLDEIRNQIGLKYPIENNGTK